MWVLLRKGLRGNFYQSWGTIGSFPKNSNEMKSGERERFIRYFFFTRPTPREGGNPNLTLMFVRRRHHHLTYANRHHLDHQPEQSLLTTEIKSTSPGSTFYFFSNRATRIFPSTHGLSIFAGSAGVVVS